MATDRSDQVRGDLPVYGPEQVRDRRGPCTVNLIGHIQPQYRDLLVEVGLRTRKQGGEDFAIRVVEDWKPLRKGA